MGSLHIKACRTGELQSPGLQDVLLCLTYTAEAFERCQNGFQAQCVAHGSAENSAILPTHKQCCVRPQGQLPHCLGLLTLGKAALAESKGFDKNVAKIQVL